MEGVTRATVNSVMVNHCNILKTCIVLIRKQFVLVDSKSQLRNGLIQQTT